MVHANGSKLKVLLITATMVGLLLGCASKTTSQGGQSSGATTAAATAVPELSAPKKPILVFEADSNKAYEVLGEVDTVLADQKIYNYEGSRDQAREHLKRVAYAKFGERLDAIINYREVTTVGGGSYWGLIGAAYGARNTDVQAKGIAVHFTGNRPAQSAPTAPSPSAPLASSTKANSSDAVKVDSRSRPLTNIEIQKRLLSLGYKAGSANGVMGAKTVEALKKFQADNELTVTGVADDETVAKLAQKAPGTPARSSSTSPAVKGAAPITAGKNPGADL